MDINTCFATTHAYHTVAYYAHLVPVALALFLSIYALLQTRFSKLAVAFFAFTLSFSLWLIGDLFPWTSSNYSVVYFTWSWLDLVNIVFFVLGALFFGVLAREKVSSWECVLLVLLCVPAFVLTLMGSSVTDFYQPVCEATNNELLTNYKLFAEAAAIVLMLVSFVIAWRGSDKRKRVQISVILGAILLFFIAFSGTEYIASTTGVYEINLYGLFVLPLFLIVMTFAITDLKLFQFRFLGTQILAYVLIIMVGSQLLFVTDATSRGLSLVTVAVSLIIGLLLVENAKREVEARLRIESLNKQLDTANKQQVTLIHFITHQLKGFVGKSRNIFSMVLEGDYGQMPDTMKPVMEEGFNSATKGAQTIQEILNAANIKSGKVAYASEPFDFKALVESVVANLKPAADAKGVVLSVGVPEGPVTFTGDRMQMENALKNMIDNSIKYTPKGSITVTLTKEPGLLRLVAKDTGVGITSEDMEHLFTEGGHGADSQKVNVDSTGFGLYIVKNIVEGHKGRVKAESEGAGKGATFTIELPTSM